MAAVVHYVLMAVTRRTMPKVVRMPDVQEVRHEAQVRGAKLHRVSDHALRRVLEATEGDVDLAATACSMDPRPKWVEEYLGPA